MISASDTLFILQVILIRLSYGRVNIKSIRNTVGNQVVINCIKVLPECYSLVSENESLISENESIG